jgi:hypothetical protein
MVKETVFYGAIKCFFSSIKASAKQQAKNIYHETRVFINFYLVFYLLYLVDGVLISVGSILPVFNTRRCYLIPVGGTIH